VKVDVIYNKKPIDENNTFNGFGMITKEHYGIKTVEKVAKSLEKDGHFENIIECNVIFMDEMKNFMPRVVSGERSEMTVFNIEYDVKGQNHYDLSPFGISQDIFMADSTESIGSDYKISHECLFKDNLTDCDILFALVLNKLTFNSQVKNKN